MLAAVCCATAAVCCDAAQLNAGVSQRKAEKLMAKMFVSHSRHDRDLVDYFARVAAGTQVQLIFEELEAMIAGPADASRIQADIESSNAVFVLVTPQLAGIAHSRDWVAWETGVAARRDVWVLEERGDLGRVEIVTPALKHCVRFDPSDAWFAYFRSVVVPYDDSQVLPLVAAGSALGGALREGESAVVGAGLGLLVATLANQRPTGVPIACGKCTARYSVHLPASEPQFRCPVCNTTLWLQLTPPVVGVLPPAKA